MFVVDFFQETPTAAEEKPATTEASAVACFVVRAPFCAFACYASRDLCFFLRNLALRRGPQQNHQPLGQPQLKLHLQLQQNNRRKPYKLYKLYKSI